MSEEPATSDKPPVVALDSEETIRLWTRIMGSEPMPVILIFAVVDGPQFEKLMLPTLKLAFPDCEQCQRMDTKLTEPNSSYYVIFMRGRDPERDLLHCFQHLALPKATYIT